MNAHFRFSNDRFDRYGRSANSARRVGWASDQSGTRLRHLVSRIWRTYWHRRAQRATMLLLMSLEERTLRDIGIAPAEIASVVYGGPDRRRSYTPPLPANLGRPTRPAAHGQTG